MTRTDQRPLPKGDLSVMHASIFAFVIGLLGSMILYLYVNTLTMILTIGSLIGYAFRSIYSDFDGETCKCFPNKTIFVPFSTKK